jgi:hypothetical protein
VTGWSVVYEGFIHVAVNDETHDLAASERRRCPLR